MKGLTLQDIQADASKAVDVGMVDLGQESDLGRSHGVIIRQEQLEAENATCFEKVLIGHSSNDMSGGLLPSYGDCTGP